MMKPPSLSRLLLGLLSLLPLAVAAQQMNYQGRLTDPSGDPLTDGQYEITFNIYDAATAGTVVWGPFRFDGVSGDGHAALADLVNGRFNVILGPLDTATRPLTAAFAGSAGAPRYLGITVAGASEILPRQQILAAPQALHADIADTVIDGGIGTAQIADGSVTPAKLAVGSAVWLSDGATVYNTNAVAIGANDVVSTEKLHVAGSLRLSAQGGIFMDTNAGIFGKNAAGNNEGFLIPRWDNNASYLNYGTGGWYIRKNDSTVVMTMDNAGNVAATGAFSAATLNGEQPPVKYEINPGRNPNWNQITIPSAVVQQYLADEEGGTIRLILRVVNTDFVRTIDEHIYIEQTSKSNNVTPGLNGYTRQEGGGESAFVLQAGAYYEIIPAPWEWIWIRNYSSPQVGPQSTPYGDFTLSVLLGPNLSATVIVYDR